MVDNTKRTVKVSAEAYRALSHQSEKGKKSIEELASTIILSVLGSVQNDSHGEQYDEKGNRIFRVQAPFQY